MDKVLFFKVNLSFLKLRSGGGRSESYIHGCSFD